MTHDAATGSPVGAEALLDGYVPGDVLRRTSGLGAMTGVQALGRLLFDQHRADQRRGWHTAGLVSGYRGSPLAGLDLVLERHADLLAEHDIRFIPGVNEELGATVVYGSQLAPQLPGPRFDGVFGLWYGKAPGVDRSVDAFKHGTWMGTTPRGGVLVAAGDDPASKSSSLPSNSTMALAESYMPVLAPVDVADVLRLGRFGFEMSRFSGAWVGFTVVTNVGDAYEVIDLGVEQDFVVPEFEWNGAPWQPTFKQGVTIPEAIALEREVLDGRLAAATAFASANGLDRIEGAVGEARLGLVASGHTYAQLRDALDRLGLGEDALRRRGIRVLRLGLTHPIDRAGLLRFADGLDEIVVVEDKRAFIETQIKEALYDLSVRPRVFGKQGPDGRALVPVHGALEADRIIVALARLLADRVGGEHVDLRHPALRPQLPALTLTPVNRTPFFCSGCPHNRSTETPEGSLAGAGIGCHAMTTFMDRSIGFTQMGGEGVSWVGAAPFTDTEHLFQNLGDGTFFHSGSLAVRQAVAAGTNITFKLLYNAAVAMTGGQHADGSVDPASVTWLLHGEGVARTVIVTDEPGKYPRGTKLAPGVTVHHRDQLDEVQRELRDTAGVTVLLYDQACAAETRRKRKRGQAPDPERRVLINEAVCEGCGDCGQKSNCLSVEPVETEFGRKTQIDQTSCNKDYSCLRGDCPSFLTVVPGSAPAGKATRPAVRRANLPADLPEPSARPSAANLVMVGIGGTGVVTANQVLATAALLSGLDARALDQTGLSQKAGAVVSHLRITPTAEGRPGLVGAGAADGYLVFDALAATTEVNLGRCDKERTVAVVSTSEVPTGRMITDPTAAYPGRSALLGRIAARTRAAELSAMDALDLAERLFGNTAAANFLVIGAAYQKGLLPVSAEAIERAIELNGVGVKTTVQAFRAGRKSVLAPDWLAEETVEETAATPVRASRDATAALALVEAATAGSVEVGEELRRILEIRVPDLAAYQNLGYARRYLDVVTSVARAERGIVAGEQVLTETVARNLYKLMAYKDEYEVARLHLDPELDRQVQERFGAGARVKYQLHPPVLRALGMQRKISFGRTARPMFRVLRALRGLRGTAADPFGYAKLRRVERELVTEYVQVALRLAAELTAGNHALAVRIAGLPDVVRGYEEIKLASVETYRARMQESLRDLAVPAEAASV
ncbi:indolepyruvate ferredoxin oxidoreductase family protein [Solihabitans fulvus]|uniref:Indolepyruvate ferredoxin oxidoreductase family protein n=1 Tax=Solihabitans fulvus TaxID=1892852 RepID=A0A5B2X4H6_9PSEU|nr:indolepyruvate ferredoxin oxidoreductase family protein [Solihabitans fulvus]KAA2258134.1 indolepyruvate ferredoxin oxidoreductase family protein [Solihabitans fulvus]